MASRAVRAVVATDRCDLCGVRVDGTFSQRTRHLRKEHPAFARGLLLRVVAPLLFLASVVVIQATGAPVWAAVVATAAALAIAGIGVAMARSARSAAGASAPRLGTLLSEGGFRFVLLAGVFLLMLILAANR